MDVVVNELHSTLDVVPDAALIDPAVLGRIVAAVTAELERREDGRAWAVEQRAAAPGEGT